MAEDKITINDVAASVRALGDKFIAQWQVNGWSPTVNAHVGTSWMAPSMSANELKDEVEFAASRVETLNLRKFTADEGKFAARLKKHADEMAFGNIASDLDASFGGVLEMINSVFRHIPPIAPPPPQVDWENIKDERELLPKDLARRLRFIDARLSELEPRSETLGQKISDIEAAHQTAEQLPADLEDLKTQRAELQQVAEDSTRASEEIKTAHTRSEDGQHRIEKLEEDSKKSIAVSMLSAEQMIKRSEQALRGSTSVGLASAFEERSKSLRSTGVGWTLGLAVALISAVAVGAYRLSELKTVLDGTKPASVVWANVILTVLGIGAPIWFAWLSTRQIGTTFKLSEDYAFKASVSQAYEGYRAEAVDIDPILRERLFASALTRIEEAPIRLLDSETHNSPLAELLANPAIRKSLEAIPGISEKILAIIPTKAGTAAAVVAPAAAIAAVLTGASEKPENEQGSATA